MNTSHETVPRQGFDVEAARKDFPILAQQIHGKPLVYLDNAATTQKPEAVIRAISDFYRHDNANIHRGVHELSNRATRAYENARGRVRRFLNAAEDAEIIFLRGVTEATNLVAHSFGQRLKPGDEILISTMEHHSNIVPWQLLCERSGAVLKVAPINDRGELILEEFEQLLSERTRLVAMVHQSNSLGTVNPVARIVELSHQAGARVLLDGAQAASHQKVDVRALDVDFYAISAHKMYGPTGIGALYGKRELLESLPPYQGGGDMILSVSFEKTEYNALPHRLEAGTPNISGPIGLEAAIDYIEEQGIDAIIRHEQDLLDYGTERLRALPGVRLIGTAAHRSSVISFVLDGVHPHDAGTILDMEGVAVRTGHHCTQPVMARFRIPATIRASLALYNTRDDLDRLVAGLKKVIEVFG